MHLTLALVMASLLGCTSGSDSPVPATPVQSAPPDVTSVDVEGNTSIDDTALQTELGLLPLGILSALEEAGIAFMREEEKLARDVYLELSSQWNQNVFENITVSEQTHMDAVLALINRYGILDPVGSNPEGVFVDPILQGLHDMLVARGSLSLIDALIVGAEIEELDIIDLDLRLQDVVDNADIELVYENLKKGSRNHLRAFIRSLDNQNFPYQPQHLTQAAFDEIINSPTEQGGI